MKVTFKTNNKPNRNGEDQIMLVVSHRNFPKPIKRATGVQMQVKHWDSEAKTVTRGDLLHDKKNFTLMQLRAKIEELPLLYRTQNKPLGYEDALREIAVLLGGAPASQTAPSPSDFFLFAEEAIKRRDGELSAGTCKQLRQTVEMVREYAPSLDMNDMHIEWFDGFFKYCRTQRAGKSMKMKHKCRIAKNLSATSTGKHQKNIVTILYEAKARHKTTGFRNFDFENLPPKVVTNEDADYVYLTEQEIEQVYRHDFSYDKRMEQVRDIFVFLCGTALRFSDIHNFTMEGEYLKLNPKKTFRKTGEQVIPHAIYPNNAEILAKYGNNLPVIANPTFNAIIKEAVGIAGIDRMDNGKPVHEQVSSHTGRRSLCTNRLIHRKWPATYVMFYSNHKSEQTFYKYIRAKKQQIAENILEFHKALYLNAPVKARA